MSTETTSTLTAVVQKFYDRLLLERLVANFVHGMFAQRRSIPPGGGKTVNFRRYNSIAAASTPLTEGVTPAGSNLSVTAVEATVAQYGDFVISSDVLNSQAVDNLGIEVVNLQAEQAAETLDTAARDILAAGTTVQYAAGRVSRVTVAAGDNINSTEIRKAVRTLKRNKVKRIQTPMGLYYVCFIHPDVAYDLMSDSDWKAAQRGQNAPQQGEIQGYLGIWLGVMFIETPLAKVFTGAGASGIDVYGSLFVGQSAYGMVDYESMKLKFIYKPEGSAGTADPLDQRTSQGWKGSWVFKILQDLALVRLESAASA